MTTTSEVEQLVSEDSSPFLTDPLILPLHLKPACLDTSPLTSQLQATNKEQCQDDAYFQLQQAELRVKNLEALLTSTQELASISQQHVKMLLKEAERDRYWNERQREEAARQREEAARQREEATKYREEATKYREEARKYREEAARQRAEATRCEGKAIQSQGALASIQSENFKLSRELLDLRHPMPLSSRR